MTDTEGAERARSPAGRPGDRTILWLFLAGAAAVTVWFYRDFIFHPERLLFGSDMLLEGFPLRRFFVDEIAAGRGVPLWTPHVYGGMPYVALLPGPIFYPSTVLYFLMPLYRAIGWTFVLHTFLAGAFGYFLARSFRLRAWSAAVCGTSFLLTGYVTSHLFGGQDGRMFAMVLMPLAFGLLERGLCTGEVRWFCGLALAVGAQILTPHTQIMYFSSLVLALYLVFHLVVRARAAGGGAWGLLRPALLTAGAFVGAAAVGAIQLLPTLALLEHVARQATETGYDFAASFGLPPQEITAFFLPDLIGSLPGLYWGSNGIKLHTEYLGGVPIALALVAIAAAFGGGYGRSHRSVVWFLAGTCVLAILFALGSETPVHRIAHAVVPMIASFRAPAMMLSVVALFVPLLAAFGWEAVLDRREGRNATGEGGEGEEARGISYVWLGILGAPAILLGLWASLDPRGLQSWALLSWYPEGWPRQPTAELAGMLQVTGALLVLSFAASWAVAWGVARRKLPELAVLALLLLTVADLARVGGRYLLTDDADGNLATDPIIETLRAEAGPGERVWALQLEQPMYRPNRFMYHGLSSATGSQKFVLDPYARLIGAVGIDQTLLSLGGVLAPLLDARYLVTRTEQTGGALELRARADGLLLYRLTSPVPHAFFPAAVEAAADPEEAVERTRANVRPLELAIVESEGDVPEAGSGVASIVSYAPDEIELDVEAGAGGLLVVSEIHHPGWRALVDGEEVPVWRANAAFRGVEVPAGSHRVRFVYESAAYAVGRWLSILATLGLGLAIGFFTWQARRPLPPRREAPADPGGW